MQSDILEIVDAISENNPYSTVFSGKYLIVDSEVTHSQKYDRDSCKVKAVIATLRKTYYYTLFCYDISLWTKIEIDKFYYLSGIVSVGSGLFLKILNITECEKK